MRQQAMGFVKGIGAGMVAGMAVLAVSSKMTKGNRRFRHRANKTIRNVGELLDNMQEIFHA